MGADLRKLYKEIKKYPLLLSIIDVTEYPMTPAEYRKVLNMQDNAYVNESLKKLRVLGIFKVPVKTSHGKVHVLTEIGEKIKRERYKELGKGKKCDYFNPALKWQTYSKIAVAKRRRKVIKAMTGKFESFTQIYKKTDLRFEKVNDTLRELLKFGIVVQDGTKGMYKLSKSGVSIKDFICKIDDLRIRQDKQKIGILDNTTHSL